MATKKDVARQLERVSSTTPTVYEWGLAPEVFTGEEMNLSGFGEHQKFDPNGSFTVNMPIMVAVDHRKQMKDAYNRGGWDAVKEYHQSVIAKIKKKVIN